jgi:hypothetical protein
MQCAVGHDAVEMFVSGTYTMVGTETIYECPTCGRRIKFYHSERRVEEIRPSRLDPTVRPKQTFLGEELPDGVDLLPEDQKQELLNWIARRALRRIADEAAQMEASDAAGRQWERQQRREGRLTCLGLLAVTLTYLLFWYTLLLPGNGPFWASATTGRGEGLSILGGLLLVWYIPILPFIRLNVRGKIAGLTVTALVIALLVVPVYVKSGWDTRYAVKSAGVT